jgi:hypothetical protein
LSQAALEWHRVGELVWVRKCLFLITNLQAVMDENCAIKEIREWKTLTHYSASETSIHCKYGPEVYVRWRYADSVSVFASKASSGSPTSGGGIGSRACLSFRFSSKLSLAQLLKRKWIRPLLCFALDDTDTSVVFIHRNVHSLTARLLHSILEIPSKTLTPSAGRG